MWLHGAKQQEVGCFPVETQQKKQKQQTLILAQWLILREVGELWNMLLPYLFFVAKQSQAEESWGIYLRLLQKNYIRKYSEVVRLWHRYGSARLRVRKDTVTCQTAALHLCPEPVRCCSGKVLVLKGPGSPSGRDYPAETERWYDPAPRRLRWSACFPPITFLELKKNTTTTTTESI